MQEENHESLCSFHKTVEAELDTEAYGYMSMLKKYNYRTWLSTDKHGEYVFDVVIDYRHPHREEFRANVRSTAWIETYSRYS